MISDDQQFDTVTIHSKSVAYLELGAFVSAVCTPMQNVVGGRRADPCSKYG